MKNLNYEFTCIVCNKLKKTNQPNQKLCGKECKKSFYKRTGKLEIPTASVGSIAEMEVCCDLLSKGYSVFRTVSASCFCDVVAIKGKEIMLIEVRTGYKDLSGKITFPKTLHTKISTPTHYGIYVTQDDEVIVRKITKEEITKFSFKN